MYKSITDSPGIFADSKTVRLFRPGAGRTDPGESVLSIFHRAFRLSG